MCKFFNLYEESLHLGVCKLAKYVRTALFSGKIYTSDKNFTRPPVATVATNSKSVQYMKVSVLQVLAGVEGKFQLRAAFNLALGTSSPSLVSCRS